MTSITNQKDGWKEAIRERYRLFLAKHPEYGVTVANMLVHGITGRLSLKELKQMDYNSMNYLVEVLGEES